MVVTGLGPASPTQGLGTERARVGPFRSFGTERARLGTLRDFSTERARLVNFRGFGTERARLGTFNQNFEIFTQNEHLSNRRVFFPKVLGENPKIVLPSVKKKKKTDPQIHRIFKLIKNFFCTFLPI